MEVALAWRSWLLFLPNTSCTRRLWGKNSKTPKASAIWGPTSPGKRRARTWKASLTSLSLWHSKRSRKLSCKCHSFYAACLCACRMYHVFGSYLSFSRMFNGKKRKTTQANKAVLGVSFFRYGMFRRLALSPPLKPVFRLHAHFSSFLRFIMWKLYSPFCQLLRASRDAIRPWGAYASQWYPIRIFAGALQQHLK